MSIAFTVSDRSPVDIAVDILALPVFAETTYGPGADAVAKTGGDPFSSFVRASDFTGKAGQTLVVPALGVKASSVLLVGLGEKRSLTTDGLRRAAALVAQAASKKESVATTLVAAATPKGRADAAQAVAEGFVLGGYKYLEYKSKEEPSTLAKVTLLGVGTDRAIKQAVAVGDAVGEAVVFARDLVNRPSREKAPADMVKFAQARLADRHVNVEVWDEARLRKERMGGVIGVGQGSSRGPRFLALTYEPAHAKGTLAMVGKGVVFDSGGLSIKPATGMETMKTDMGGGAAVIAAMSALKDAGVKARVIGFVPLVENMPSGTAIRPGDVLTMRNQKTVEVLNTDAEGRLILADALSLASEKEPDAIVDLATLTGACMVALGDKVAGLMTNNDAWGKQVRAAADKVHESVWPLPLPTEYAKELESEVADLKNIGGRYGGALTAGIFLEEFVANDIPWVHLDIAGPARAEGNDGYTPKGGSGFGVRALVKLAQDFVPPKR